MARYAAGDPQAFEELFRRYEPRAYAFFLRRTGTPQGAEDLYQELFLRIHRARDRFDPSRPFAPWFFQIANRLVVDEHRRVYHSREIAIENRDSPATGPSSEAQVASREEISRLLQTLSPEECYVLLSSKVEGLGYPEIADQLGKSVDAVKKMTSRLMQRLRVAAAPAASLDQPAR